MFSAHFEIKLSKIGRIELELFKFHKWTDKKKHPVRNTVHAGLYAI